MNPNKYIKREDFLQYWQTNLPSHMQYCDDAIVFDTCIEKDDFLMLEDKSIDNPFYTKQYIHIANEILPVLKSLNVSPDMYLKLLKELPISFIGKEKHTYMPKNSDEKLKFPPAIKDTLYFVKNVIGLHDLYEAYIVNSSFNIPVKKIYRLESSDGLGLYNGDNFRFAKGSSYDFHPSPEKDNKFHHLFKKNKETSDHAKKWYFAFASLDDAKLWLNGSLTEDVVKEYNTVKTYFLLKEIYVPEPFVIEGDRQVIFKKEYTINKKVLDFELLNTTNTHICKISL